MHQSMVFGILLSNKYFVKKETPISLRQRADRGLKPGMA